VLDVRKLNMLSELDRLGTIAAVARELSLTPPGISMQLAALERELGLKLMEKQGRRVVVTPAGHLLAKHGSSIVDALAVAEMEAAALRDGAAGTYRVGAFPTAARTIIPSAWKALNEVGDRSVELRLLEMEPSDSIPALTAGEVELAIAHSYSNMPPVSGPGLTVRNIGTETVRLAISETEWRGPTDRPIDLGTVSGHDWIVPSKEWTCYDMVRRATDLAGFEVRSVAEATDFGVQLALVRAGLGVALIPELGARSVPEGVVMLDLKVPVYRSLLLVTRRSSASDAGLVHVQRLIADAAKAFLPVVDPGRR
jgi:DNA-binding transcriptional LysR family regulator